MQQETFLEKCPKGQRRFHELMYTHGNIVYRYHSESKEYSPNEEDYKEWLQGLPSNVRKGMEERGFENCKTVLPFTRYVMEKNDIGLDEYVQARMGKEDYEEYNSLLSKGEVP